MAYLKSMHLHLGNKLIYQSRRPLACRHTSTDIGIGFDYHVKTLA